MSLNIENLSVQFKETYHLISNKVSEWAGRAISVLKSGRESALPYFQDKYVAVASLVVANLILIEITAPLLRYLERKLNGSDEEKMIKLSLQTALIIGVLGGGVIGFTKFAQLPLTKGATLGISFATLAVRMAIEAVKGAKAEVEIEEQGKA